MFEKVCERNCLIFNVKWSIKLTTNIAIEKMHRDQGAESMRLRRSLHTNGRSGRFLVDVAMSSWSQDLPSVGAPSWDGASWWTQPWADDLRACPLWGLHHGMVLPGGCSHEKLITGLALCGGSITGWCFLVDAAMSSWSQGLPSVGTPSWNFQLKLMKAGKLSPCFTCVLSIWTAF